MDAKFKAERKAALAEIQAAFMQKMDVLAKEGIKYADNSKLSLPEMLEAQEKFRWTPAVLAAAIDLQADKPLKEIFARVSKRYEPPAGFPRKSPASLAEDLQQTAGQSGRDSAFADIRRMLDIAERDFDMTYRALSRDEVQYFLKKHPIGEEHIRFAHKENQRHFMKESIREVRAVLDVLQNPPQAGNAAKPQHPPSP